jgi:hypothetical protein
MRVSEFAGLAGATGGAGLRVKIQNGHLAAQVGERNRTTVIAGDAEIRSGIADF